MKGTRVGYEKKQTNKGNESRPFHRKKETRRLLSRKNELREVP